MIFFGPSSPLYLQILKSWSTYKLGNEKLVKFMVIQIFLGFFFRFDNSDDQSQSVYAICLWQIVIRHTFIFLGAIYIYTHTSWIYPPVTMARKGLWGSNIPLTKRNSKRRMTSSEAPHPATCKLCFLKQDVLMLLADTKDDWLQALDSQIPHEHFF